MSERSKAQLAGWAIGVLTTIAISLAGWSLTECNALGAESARQGQEVKDMRALLEEVRSDVKDILRALPQKK
jgi:hypothetical protein